MLPLVLKSTLILTVASLAAVSLRRRSAAARHLVWTAAAAALLALPLLAWLMPAVRVPVSNTGPGAVFQVFVTATPLAGRPHAGQTVPSAAPHPGVNWIPRLWTAGTAASLLQMLWAYGMLLRLRRSARPFPNPAAAQALAGSLDIRHPVEFLEMPRAAMPMTCGIFRPAVLMPAGSSNWTPERLRIVLLHELAHVRRGDLATHLLARLALSAYWWNPLAWYAWRGFVQERERATDDLVLAAGERASDYAGHLLEIARSFRPEPATAAAALAMARRSQLEGRLVAILDSRVSRRPAGRRAAAIAVLAAVTVAAPFAAVQAQESADQRTRFEATRKSLETAGQLNASDIAGYSAALVKLGNLAVEVGLRADAEKYYASAVALGDRPQIVPALLYFGRKAYGDGDYAKAEDYFQRALDADPNGPKAASALTGLAEVRQHQPGREAEAEVLYRKAIAAGNPRSYDLADTLTNYAFFLRKQGRGEEAAQQDVRSAEVRASVGGKPETAVSSANVFRAGGGVTAPRLIYKVEPAYTEEARAAKFQGTVLLYIEVQPDGTASNIRVVRSLGLGLDEKAIEAVRQWRFSPGMKDGVAVPVRATIEVNFRLM